MCTVSWLHQDDGYHLLCNRDERRARKLAAWPCVEQLDGVGLICPRDGDFGGTWIAVNELGVSVCLLNGASVPALPGVKESRGQLLLRLATARTAAEVGERTWRTELEGYAPFTVVALEPGRPAAVIEWDGAEKALQLSADWCSPLISSSYDRQGALAARSREYARLIGTRATVESLYSFHESHLGQPGPYSPCMHRADAETVSFSWVTVTAEYAGFFYAPGPPCQLKPGQTARLALVQ